MKPNAKQGNILMFHDQIYPETSPMRTSIYPISLLCEVINEQQWIILSGISIYFCIVRNTETVIPLKYPEFSNVFHI